MNSKEWNNWFVTSLILLVVLVVLGTFDIINILFTTIIAINFICCVLTAMCKND